MNLITKYGFELQEKDLLKNFDRLTNQLWKLIPMRENDENWLGQLDTVIIEVAGLHEMIYIDERFVILLAKLEGLRRTEIGFMQYRKTVFEAISLLREIVKK